jgi:hypothetical protein
VSNSTTALGRKSNQDPADRPQLVISMKLWTKVRHDETLRLPDNISSLAGAANVR